MVAKLPWYAQGVYVTLRGVRRASRHATWLVEHLLLDIEERYRFVHENALSETYSLDVEKNRSFWNEYDWIAGGEEWTPSAEWKSDLVNRVLGAESSEALRACPQGKILEIGPGAGRWTEHLILKQRPLLLVDIAEKPLELLRERLGPNDLSYILGTGHSLPGVENDTLAFVWSYDAFVHMTPWVIRSYLHEIARCLQPGGRAVIHYADRSRNCSMKGNMSRHWFEYLAREACLDVKWSGNRYAHDKGDMLTALERPTRPAENCGA